MKIPKHRRAHVYRTQRVSPEAKHAIRELAEYARHRSIRQDADVIDVCFTAAGDDNDRFAELWYFNENERSSVLGGYVVHRILDQRFGPFRWVRAGDTVTTRGIPEWDIAGWDALVLEVLRPGVISIWPTDWPIEWKDDFRNGHGLHRPMRCQTKSVIAATSPRFDRSTA